jgi:hypothetical protein
VAPDTIGLVMDIQAPTQGHTHAPRRERSERSRVAYIRWKLCTGRLPNVNVPEIYAAPGSGECCDACDELLAPTQLMIAIPLSSEKTFALLHARCYLLWNDELRVPRVRMA